MKILIILFFYLYCIVFLVCGNIDKPPPDLCHEDEPFRTIDRRCHSFSNLCFNTGDQQCNQLLNACKQCPPSNFTIEILRDIRSMSKYQSNFIQKIIDKNIFNKFEQFNSTQKSLTNKSNESPPKLSNDFCAILLVIIIIILVVQFLETRFKMFIKCFQWCITKKKVKCFQWCITKKKDNLQYALVESRKRKHLNELESKMNESFGNLEKKFDSQFEEIIVIKNNIENLSKKILDHIEYSQSQPSVTIKFQPNGIQHKYVELYVHNNHNVLQLKQRLCTALINLNTCDYKRMKMIYNEKILDDNDYLLKYIDSSINFVHFIIDETINVSEIIIVKLNGKMRLPEIIQIKMNESIENFLSTISKFLQTKEFCAYKEVRENNQLKMINIINNNNKNNNKIDSYFNVKDENIVKVVTIEEGELTLRSIFNEIDSYTVKYKNIDKISRFSRKENYDTTNIIFFYRNKIIDENKFIFQFDISNDSQVKFCRFKKFQGITEKKSIFKHANWEIYFATHNVNEDILIKKYNISSKNWKKDDWVLKELEIFLITKSHSRFIQLNDVYVDDNSFYVSMENMIGGTLRYYLKNNKEFDLTFILEWAAQILEGLFFLHKNNIVYRVLNPLSILVGVNNYLKLSNFNLSKYHENRAACSIMGKNEQDGFCYIKVRYMAPEILESRECGFPCDVWSFGAVLVRIVTGKRPYPGMSPEDAQQKIIETGNIEYNLPNKFDPNMKSFIDSCFAKDPSIRSQIKDLVEDEMIKNSLR